MLTFQQLLTELRKQKPAGPFELRIDGAGPLGELRIAIDEHGVGILGNEALPDVKRPRKSK